MSDLMLGISTLLENGWRFICDTNIPGTDFSVASLLIGLLAVDLGFRILGIVLGFHFGEQTVITGAKLYSTHFGSGSGGKAKVSDARKNDEI